MSGPGLYRATADFANFCTEAAYLSSVARWTDAAKFAFFECQDLLRTVGEDRPHQGPLVAPARAGANPAPSPAPSPVTNGQAKLGTLPWVIRRHGFLFHRPRRYHRCTEYRSNLAITTSLTALGKSSLEVEHALYHQLDGPENGRELLCQTFTSIVVLSAETGRPAPHGFSVPNIRGVSFTVSEELPASRPARAAIYTTTVRFSDTAGDHISNSQVLCLLQDALLSAKSQQRSSSHSSTSQAEPLEMRSLYIEYHASAFPGDVVSIYHWDEAPAVEPAPKPLRTTTFFHLCRNEAVLVRARMDFGGSFEGSPPAKL